MKLNDIVAPVLRLPRGAKRALVLTLDVFILTIAVAFAYYLRLGIFIPLTGVYFIPVPVALAIALPIFIRLGLYRAIYRYSGWSSILVIVAATTLYGAIFALIFTVISIPGIPRTIGLIQPILVLVLVAGSRTVARYVLGGQVGASIEHGERMRVLIYGAGRSGRQLAAALSMSGEVKVVGFLDDDRRLVGSTLDRRPVYGTDDIPALVSEYDIANVLLAMPDATRKERFAILERLRAAQVQVQSLPDMSDLASGKVTLSDLRPLSIDDLLGREPVAPDEALMRQTVEGSCVVVTGAGGSIGSELCRQIAALGPSRLLLIEQSEFSLYAIHAELEPLALEHGFTLVPLLGSVQDQGFLARIFTRWSVEVVFHAAAFKHVPLVEQNVVAGIRNNVGGTRAAALAAAQSGVARFVLVSTDKAVRPTNIMGASKRLAELVLQALAREHEGTLFSMVRFGNVLGSSGSVVPRFREQIQNGGPVTLTHEQITRYFMSIPEAAQLVIQSSAMARGGDVFVLDMGEPVLIYDLATRMIELSGLSVRDAANPEGDIEIAVTGLRPGEKLFEELLLGDDPQPTRHERIMRAQDACLSWEELTARLVELEEAMRAGDARQIRVLMQSLPLKYEPNDPIADLSAGPS